MRSRESELHVQNVVESLMTLHLIDEEVFRRNTVANSEARALLAQSDIETW